MGVKLNTFSLLLWKNLVSELYAWPWFVFEVFCLLIGSIMIVISPGLFNNEYVHNFETDVTPIVRNVSSIYNLYDEKVVTRGSDTHFTCLYYVPKNNFTSKVMNATGFKLNLPITVGFDNEELMDTSFTGKTCMAAVLFYGIKKDSDEIPDRLKYALRFPGELRSINKQEEESSQTFWITRCHGDMNIETFSPNDCLYLREGFLQLQHRIFLEWLHLRNVSQENIPSLTINLMAPMDEGDKICYFDNVLHFDWFWYQWFFFLPIIIMIKRFSREINEHILTCHSLYGMSNYHHWLAHFIVCLAHLIILNSVLFIIFGIEWSTDHKYMFLRLPPKIFLAGFLLINSIKMILFSMTLSILFRNGVNAVLFYISTWICSFTILATGLNALIPISWSIGIYLLIFSNNVLAYSIKLLEKWNDITKRNFAILIIILFIFNFIMTAFILVGNWLFLFKYREHVADNSRSPLAAWYRRKEKKSLHIPYTMQRNYWQNLEFISFKSSGMLIMRNVYAFNKSKNFYPILKEVTLRFYRGEISIILGPINSGKDSIIRVLAGWQKYYGSINCTLNKNFYRSPKEYINLMDISINGPSLFEHLTVAQNLRYFIQLKKYSNEKPYSNVDDIYYSSTAKQNASNRHSLDLVEAAEDTNVQSSKGNEQKKSKNNRNVQSSQENQWKHLLKIETERWMRHLVAAKINKNDIVGKLSRDQRQLIHLCCILCNSTPIILLNRPTDCMNPVLQQIYWNILRKEKLSRIIVMTTLCVDEANIIGDRIAIMGSGSILAWGSPLFLRTHFSKHYKMIILLDSQRYHKSITELLQSHISSITVIKSTDQRMLTYMVPKNKRKLFQVMLLDLELHYSEWGIRNVSLLSNDLKDIYMNLTLDNASKRNITPISNVLRFLNETGWKSNTSSFLPVLYKKVINLRQLFIPCVTILFVVTVVLILYELTKRLHPVSSIDKGMIFGLQLEGDSRKMINDEWNKECSFLEITEVNVADSANIEMDAPIYYTYKTFNCFHDISYFEYLEGAIRSSTRLGAIELLEENNLQVWINEHVYHSAPLLINLAENMILSKIYTNITNIYVVTINKPMTVPLATRVNLIEYQVYFLRLPVTIGIIMPFTLSTFVIRRVEEHGSHFYTLQKISGMRLYTFWILTFIWDMLTYFVYSLIFLLVMMFTTIEGFGLTPKLMTLFLLNLHAIPIMFIIYIISFYMTKNTGKSFLVASIIQLYSGIYLFILYWDFLKMTKINYLFMLSPSFALLEGVGNVYIASKERRECELRCDNFPGCEYENICSTFPKCCFETFFQWQQPGILLSVTYLAISSIIWCTIFCLIMYCRAARFKKYSKKINRMASGYFLYEDEEVIKQKITVSDMKPSQAIQYNVVVDQLGNKIPKKKAVKVVETISFAVKRGRCLGIYGVKSGKSNLIMNLVGGNKYEFGEVYLNQWNLKQRTRHVYDILGFSSLKMSLTGAFTVRQLFKYIFKLRGAPEKKIPEWIRELTISFNLQPFLNHKIETLPPMIKHRCKIALAFIARNRVYIFDDLTRGLSPHEQHLIWNAIRHLRDSGFTIIFTTNDSYECEELADDMIMLKDNRVIAIGTPHVLRLKYTIGVNVDIKLRLSGNTDDEIQENLHLDIDNLNRFIAYLHIQSELLSANGNYLHYYLPIIEINYSFLFGTLERNRTRLNILDYTISIATLRSAYGNIYESLSRKQPFKKSE